MKYQPPYGISDPDAPYIAGDPTIARQGSILPPGAAEYPQREIVHVIEKNNLAPSDQDMFQLTRATRSGWVNWVIDTGSINTLSVALDPALTMYRAGLPLRVLVKANNTGPTTINVNGLGNRSVKRANGAELEANDLRTGMIALLVDDGTQFQLVNFQGVLASSINNYYVHIPYAEDTGTINSVVGVYTPAITGAVSGDLVLIKIKNKNSDAVMFKVNGLAAVPIVRNDGQPLQGFDLELNEILLLVYNVDRWQVLRMVRSQVMYKLTANLILYVRTDGNDGAGHDGSINDAAHAFLTVQRAIDFVRNNFAIAGRKVTIQLGIAGTYTGSVHIKDCPGSVAIRGDPANVSSYVIKGSAVYSVPENNAVMTVTGSGTDITVQGVTFLSVEPRAHWVGCYYSAFLTVDDCNFTGTNGNYAYLATTQASIIVLNNLRGFSHCAAVFIATEGGGIILGAWYTNLTLNGIAFSSAFCIANVSATISLYYGYLNYNPAGAQYGYRYISAANSVVATFSGGAQWLPGNAPGICDASSVYH